MGYFDGLADAYFKKDEAGQNFYYPWGVAGAGYKLKSEEQKNEVRQFVKKWYMFTLPAVILSQALLNFWIAAVLAVVSYIYYFIKYKKITKDLEKSQVKLKISESYKNSAQSHNLSTLIFFEIFMIAMIGLALFLINKESGFSLVMPSLTIAFFGFGAIAIGYMISIKIRKK